MAKTEKTNDIFDKIMGISIFRPFQPLYRNYKSSLLYLFFGGLAFFMNIILYYFFSEICSVDVLMANVVSWIICATFQFITNRTWVFPMKAIGIGNFIRQMLSFYTSCLITLMLEEVIIFVFIVQLNFNSMVVKIVGQVVVIVTNYILRKCIVFREKIPHSTN